MSRPNLRIGFSAPTYSDCRAILNYSLFPFLPPETIKKVNNQLHEIELNNGTLYLWRSAEKPQSVRAAGDLDFWWGDEAEQYPKHLHQIIRGRTAERKGTILYTTSPQKWFGSKEKKRLSWIFERFNQYGILLTPDTKEHYLDKHRIAVFNWSIADNIHFPQEEARLLREEYGPLWAAQELDAQYIDLYAEGIFLEKWFKGIRPYDLSDYSERIIAFDPAISERGGADYTVAQVWGRWTDQAHLIHEARVRINYPKQKELLRTLITKFDVHRIYVEDAFYQRSIIEDLAGEGFPIVGVKPDGNKEARAKRLSGPVAAGKVRINDRFLTPDFLMEFTSFPNWTFDDRVDAAGYAVHQLLGRGPRPVLLEDVPDSAFDFGM